MDGNRTTLKNIRRVHILGAAGSGKTTLAGILARRLAAPWFELDTIAYEGGFAARRSLEVRLADLQAIAVQSAWVTEGFYLWWIDDLLQAADAVVWLDLPWAITLYRIVARHARASLAGTNRHPGVGKLLRFIWGCSGYYTDRAPAVPAARDDDGAVNRLTIAQYLAPYAGKVVHCCRPADVDGFVALLENNHHATLHHL